MTCIIAITSYTLPGTPAYAACRLASSMCISTPHRDRPGRCWQECMSMTYSCRRTNGHYPCKICMPRPQAYRHRTSCNFSCLANLCVASPNVGGRRNPIKETSSRHGHYKRSLSTMPGGLCLEEARQCTRGANVTDCHSDRKKSACSWILCPSLLHRIPPALLQRLLLSFNAHMSR
jgi:hypothetical protein